MAPRLKVFVTSDGLTDYVVAASSRPKALAAWGAHQDLFKTGGARETDDPDLVAAATASPGEVLRRPA
ncbi:MAG TPA: cell envelope biogenesis protein TolA, partial [Phenylobacterium sp.]|nr:cell envelope biogenesis protein TolA [Phenylobacterium sp.]